MNNIETTDQLPAVTPEALEVFKETLTRNINFAHHLPTFQIVDRRGLPFMFGARTYWTNKKSMLNTAARMLRYSGANYNGYIQRELGIPVGAPWSKANNKKVEAYGLKALKELIELGEFRIIEHTGFPLPYDV